MNTSSELFHELKRRHLVLIKSVAIAASLLMIATFFVLIRTVILVELEKVYGTAQQLRQRGMHDTLVNWVDALEGYYLFIETPSGSITTKNLVGDPHFDHFLKHKPRKDRHRFKIIRLANTWKLMLVDVNGGEMICVSRSDGTLLYHLIMIGILLLVVGFLLYQLLRGYRYLVDPVEKEMALMRALDQAKERFFASIFHELGTPLTSLMARLEVMIDASDHDRETKDLERAYVDAQRVSLISGDQLQRARFESGTIHLSFEPIHALDFSDAIQIRLELLMKHHDCHMQVEVDSSLTFQGDRIKLEQAMINLLTNAMKFCHPKGLIKMTINTAKGYVQLSITDGGPGFDLDLVPRLIKPFQYGRQTRPTKTESTGLGLYLVNAIAKSHGGTLSFRHQPEAFTATLSFPFHRAESDSPGRLG